METIEMIVYLVVTVIVGGIIILFITGISPDDIFNSLKGIVMPQNELKYEKITSEELALKAYNLWSACGFGIKSTNLTLYVKSGPEISKSMLFSTYKKMNFCYSIQSKNNSCGEREDVIINNDLIKTPSIVNLNCDAASKKLIIG
jgi:hypothetical protein